MQYGNYIVPQKGAAVKGLDALGLFSALPEIPSATSTIYSEQQWGDLDRILIVGELCKELKNWSLYFQNI